MRKDHDWGFHIYIRGIILFGFMLLLFAFIASGKLSYYIAPKMRMFTYFGVGVFALLGTVQFFRSTSKSQEEELNCDCGTDHRPKGSPISQFLIYLLFVLPVLAGFMIPEKALDSSVAQKRGVKFGSGLYSKPDNGEKSAENSQAEEKEIDADEYLKDPEGYIKKMEERAANEPQEEPQEISSYYRKTSKFLQRQKTITVTSENFLDIMGVFDMQPDPFTGKQIKMTGFVYREPGFPKSQGVAARFAMNCCSADAAVYGTLMKGEALTSIKNDTWVTVSGTLDKTTYKKQNVLIITISKLKKIDEPKEPYVYPSVGSLTAN
ncbi:TIGR03943 family putative permease subunit [Fictibacillus fluitans]|uniref:TIGR03943 family protein n=1 Tax=Fictibacillus fluitans TaxID=3058422 RepID=A0ABT8HZH5_9BACL|nr:TIGR03943 family protein [Fictibacillus sp. NE201]MDN4526177.1 TIGR03943 family protein [Fictibacillus sp. NE201]